MMTRDEMKYRKRLLGLTYEDISRLSGVPIGTVHKFFLGYTDSPRVSTMEAFEKVLAEKPESYEVPAEDGKFMVQEAAVPLYYGDSAREDLSYDTPGLFGKRQGEYTIEDYYRLPEGERFELIDGVLYDMGAPTLTHQDIVGNIYFELKMHIRNNKGPCKVYVSPVDVHVNPFDNKTMVQPDVMVICKKEKIEIKTIEGAPDLVVEVVSPSSRKRDGIIKYQKYRDTCVREYWIVDPMKGFTTVHHFSDGKETGSPEVYPFSESIPVGIWNGECQICIADFE